MYCGTYYNAKRNPKKESKYTPEYGAGVNVNRIEVKMEKYPLTRCMARGPFASVYSGEDERILEN
jgi:hypothetical protein